MKITKKILLTIVAVVFAAATFIGGYFLGVYNTSKGAGKITWVLDYFKDNYLFGDYDADQDTYDTFAKMIAGALGDEYSEYYTKEEYAQLLASNQGSKSGTGLTFLITTPPNGHPLDIFRVIGNSPAEQAGVTAGGRVVNVNGVVVETQNDFAIAMSLIPTGQPFEMTVKYNGNNETFTLSKENYTANLVTVKDSSGAYRFNGEKGDEWVRYSDGDSNLGNAIYIAFSNFQGDNTYKNIKTALEYGKAQNRDTVVIDLRGNGGGYVDLMGDIAKLFIDEKNPTMAIAQYKNGDEYNFKSNSTDYFEFERVFVIADQNSASASESLIGALMDYGVINYSRLIVQNEVAINGLCHTFGKGIMQTTYVNPYNKDALKITTAYIVWPKTKTVIHGNGVYATAENSTTTNTQTMQRLYALLGENA